MRKSSGWLALPIVAVGILFAGWGPALFSALTGSALPAPAIGDPAAMFMWACMGIFRVLGGALVVIGAVGMALAIQPRNPRAAYRALFASAAFGLLITAAQAEAVWLSPLGVVFALPFVLAMLLGWRGARPAARGAEV
jgi:hypothetical protein